MDLPIIQCTQGKTRLKWRVGDGAMVPLTIKSFHLQSRNPSPLAILCLWLHSVELGARAVEELDEVGGGGGQQNCESRPWRRERDVVTSLFIPPQLLPDHLGGTIVGMSSSTAAVADPELAKKSCVPCNSKDIYTMSEDSAKKLLEQVGGWELATEGDVLKLHRAWKVKNFVKGLELLQLVATIAEEEGHHPDLHLVGWNNVKIDVWTHSVRGLTDNDFILAAKINNLNLEGLLSKKGTVQK